MVFKINAKKDHWKRDNSAFTVLGVIKDESVVRTHCAKLLDAGDETVINNLNEDDEIKEDGLEEGLVSKDYGIGSQMDLVEIEDDSPTEKLGRENCWMILTHQQC